MTEERTYVTLAAVILTAGESATLSNVSHAALVIRSIVFAANLASDGDLIWVGFDGAHIMERTGAAMLGPYSGNLGVHISLGFEDELEFAVESSSGSYLHAIASGYFVGQRYG